MAEENWRFLDSRLQVFNMPTRETCLLVQEQKDYWLGDAHAGLWPVGAKEDQAILGTSVSRNDWNGSFHRAYTTLTKQKTKHTQVK
jgi:hypothetical protein